MCWLLSHHPPYSVNIFLSVLSLSPHAQLVASCRWLNLCAVAQESVPSISLHLLQFKCFSYFSKNIPARPFSSSSIFPRLSIWHEWQECLSDISSTEMTLSSWKAKSSSYALEAISSQFPSESVSVSYYIFMLNVFSPGLTTSAC